MTEPQKIRDVLREGRERIAERRDVLLKAGASRVQAYCMALEEAWENEALANHARIEQEESAYVVTMTGQPRVRIEESDD